MTSWHPDVRAAITIAGLGHLWEVSFFGINGRCLMISSTSLPISLLRPPESVLKLTICYNNNKNNITYQQSGLTWYHHHTSIQSTSVIMNRISKTRDLMALCRGLSTESEEREMVTAPISPSLLSDYIN